MKNCEWCGKEFRTSKSDPYCCKKCAYDDKSSVQNEFVESKSRENVSGKKSSYRTVLDQHRKKSKAVTWYWLFVLAIGMYFYQNQQKEENKNSVSSSRSNSSSSSRLHSSRKKVDPETQAYECFDNCVDARISCTDPAKYCYESYDFCNLTCCSMYKQYGTSATRLCK